MVVVDAIVVAVVVVVTGGLSQESTGRIMSYVLFQPSGQVRKHCL